MKKLLVRFITLSLCLAQFPICFAQPNWGIRIAPLLIAKDPPDTKGLQLLGFYDPDCFHWRRFNIYFDGGISYFQIPASNPHRSIYMLSIAPVFHYSFKSINNFIPYIELSIGPSYLSHIRFGERDLGNHFSFQDRIGVGLARHAWSVGLYMLHFSNAHLAKNNSGITAPVLLDVTYRFQ